MARSKQGMETAEESAKPAMCTICGKPATRLVDGEPSCDEHANLVYEDQVESYTQRHLIDGDWLEHDK